MTQDTHWQGHGVLPEVEAKPGRRVSSRKIREAVEAEEAEKAAITAKEELRREVLADHRDSPGLRGISPGTKSARLSRRRSRVKAGAKSRARNRR